MMHPVKLRQGSATAGMARSGNGAQRGATQFLTSNWASRRAVLMHALSWAQQDNQQTAYVNEGCNHEAELIASPAITLEQAASELPMA